MVCFIFRRYISLEIFYPFCPLWYSLLPLKSLSFDLVNFSWDQTAVDLLFLGLDLIEAVITNVVTHEDEF